MDHSGQRWIVVLGILVGLYYIGGFPLMGLGVAELLRQLATSRR